MDSFSRKLDIFHSVITKKLNPETGLIKGKFLLFFFFLTLKDLFKLLFLYGKERGGSIIKDDTLYIHIESLNNYRSLKFFEKYYNIEYFTKAEASYLPVATNLGKLALSNSFRKKWIFLWKIFLSEKYSIKNYRALNRYFYVYENALEEFRNKKPRAVFFANDHNPFSRSLLLALNDFNISTFYYQHGSISTNFPPLKFKASFLYGLHDFKTYQSCGKVESNVHLVGIQRMDGYARESNISELEDVRKIGVAYNSTDVMENVNRLIKTLLKDDSLNFDVVVRPHPRESRSIEPELLAHPQVYQSNPETENSQDFLLTIDMILAGTSGILLEGVLLNKWAIECNIQKDYLPKDYYGYIQNKIAYYCPDVQNINDIIKNIDFQEKPLRKAKQYDASIDEAHFSRVGKHISEILNDQYGFKVFQK